jgi:hypothetical protein
MEKPSQKTKEVENLSNSNDDLNGSWASQVEGRLKMSLLKRKKKMKPIE